MDTFSEPSPILGLPWSYVLIGGVVLYFLFGTRVGGSDYTYEKAKATRDYRNKLSFLKDEYPTRGRAAGRAVKSGYDRAKGLF